jgi:hypothetical protein
MVPIFIASSLAIGYVVFIIGTFRDSTLLE